MVSWFFSQQMIDNSGVPRDEDAGEQISNKSTEDIRGELEATAINRTKNPRLKRLFGFGLLSATGSSRWTGGDFADCGFRP